MDFLAVTGEVFSKAHLDTFAGLLVALAAAILSLLPLLVIWLQLKLRNEINELRASMARNGGKLDVVAKQTSRRAADGQVVVSGQVRVVPSEGLDRGEAGPLFDVERRRDTAPGALHEMGRPDSDSDDANTHQGAI
jgi:hypothetical protein